MKTTNVRQQETILTSKLSELTLYDFIMESFNIIISPSYWAERNGIKDLEDLAIREIVLNELHEELDPTPSEKEENEKKEIYWPMLSDAETRAENALKKVCRYAKGLYESLRLRLSLFVILNEDDAKRIVYLLSSSEESKRFGGLRSLHLNKYQAEALLSISKEIGEFLAERYLPDEGNVFPEKQITAFLETATDKELQRILYLISSGDDRMIHGGLKSLMLTKTQCSACKEEGIDTVINMVSQEMLRRENELKLNGILESEKELAIIKNFLIEVGFKENEAERMLKVTDAYAKYTKLRSKLPKELIKEIA